MMDMVELHEEIKKLQEHHQKEIKEDHWKDVEVGRQHIKSCLLTLFLFRPCQ